MGPEGVSTTIVTVIYLSLVVIEQEQRDYYDMKRGFEKDHRGHAKIPVEQRDLFFHVPRPASGSGDIMFIRQLASGERKRLRSVQSVFQHRGELQ